MQKEARIIRVAPESELALLTREAVLAGVALIVDTGEARYPLQPVGQPPGGSRGRLDRRTSPADPLWRIIGIADQVGSTDDPTDVAENKDRYLAEAYAASP